MLSGFVQVMRKFNIGIAGIGAVEESWADFASN
jgi:hypothetical protein